jgi:hypothetical protein
VSPSRLSFTDRGMEKVWRLPEKMDGPFARPEEVKDGA